jgi:transposase
MRPVTTFVRSLTSTQRQALHQGLRSSDAFTLRRCQILLASSNGETPLQIARHLGCTPTTVRNTVHAFAAQGRDCLSEKSSRPKSTKPLLDCTFQEPLRHLLHQSPRTFAKPHSTWTLASVAEVCYQKGWTPRLLSIETIRMAIRRLGISWQRAKHGISSPDPAYARKKITGPTDSLGTKPSGMGVGVPG